MNALRTRRTRTAVGSVVTALMLVFVSACSGGANDTGGDKATTTGAATTPTSGGNLAAMVDIVECEPQDGNGVSTGTIEHGGAEATAYDITIGFYDLDGEQLGTGSATTEEADPGAEVPWSVTASDIGTISSDDLTCRTVSIQAAQ